MRYVFASFLILLGVLNLIRLDSYGLILAALFLIGGVGEFFRVPDEQ